METGRLLIRILTQGCSIYRAPESTHKMRGLDFTVRFTESGQHQGQLKGVSV